MKKKVSKLTVYLSAIFMVSTLMVSCGKDKTNNDQAQNNPYANTAYGAYGAYGAIPQICQTQPTNPTCLQYQQQYGYGQQY